MWEEVRNMTKTKHNWIDDLERGDIIQRNEPGVTYSFVGINEAGEYMLYGMPYGHSREVFETFTLVKKKNEIKINDHPRIKNHNIGAELGYTTLEQIHYQYNGIIEFELSFIQDINSFISRLIKEKWNFTVDGYTSTILKIKFYQVNINKFKDVMI